MAYPWMQELSLKRVQKIQPSQGPKSSLPEKAKESKDPCCHRKQEECGNKRFSGPWEREMPLVTDPITSGTRWAMLG